MKRVWGNVPPSSRVHRGHVTSSTTFSEMLIEATLSKRIVEVGTHLSSITDWPLRARAACFKCDRLAAHCFRSERQLERHFRFHFQKAPKQWMQELRMSLARELIEHGYSTKAVASELCYNGPCQFCREFKKFFGHPPQHFAPLPQCRIQSMMSGLAHPSGLNVRSVGNTNGRNTPKNTKL
jgi:AraC-like DNA-binding protein